MALGWWTPPPPTKLWGQTVTPSTYAAGGASPASLAPGAGVSGYDIARTLASGGGPLPPDVTEQQWSRVLRYFKLPKRSMPARGDTPGYPYWAEYVRNEITLGHQDADMGRTVGRDIVRVGVLAGFSFIGWKIGLLGPGPAWSRSLVGLGVWGVGQVPDLPSAHAYALQALGAGITAGGIARLGPEATHAVAAHIQPTAVPSPPPPSPGYGFFGHTPVASTQWFTVQTGAVGVLSLPSAVLHGVASAVDYLVTSSLAQYAALGLSIYSAIGYDMTVFDRAPRSPPASTW